MRVRGGSWHPTPRPRPYQEEKHWRVLITHCSFTRDPPQKCMPALRGREGQVPGRGDAAYAAVPAGSPLTGCGC